MISKASVLRSILKRNYDIVTELGLKNRLELPKIVIGTQAQLIHHYASMVDPDMSEELLSAIDDSLRPVMLIRADNYPMKYIYMPIEHLMNLITITAFNEEFEMWYELHLRRLYGHTLQYIELFSMYNEDAYMTNTVYDEKLKEYINQLEEIRKDTSPLDFHGFLTKMYNLQFEHYAAHLANLNIFDLISVTEKIQFEHLMTDNNECQKICTNGNIIIYPFIGGNS